MSNDFHWDLNKYSLKGPMTEISPKIPPWYGFYIAYNKTYLTPNFTEVLTIWGTLPLLKYQQKLAFFFHLNPKYIYLRSCPWGISNFQKII